MIEIIDKNYHNCDIRIEQPDGEKKVYFVSHNITHMGLHLFNFAEALRAAKLLDLEYRITEWYNLV